MGQQKGKEEVVKEYLEGGVSLRGLSRKYGIDHRTIHRWVKAHESGRPVGESSKELAEMPKEVGRLQRELYEARLHVKLLETMIDIAEEDMGIAIRKKSGARQ